MERNNIFNFATSELSQDAFICWLCNWVNFDDNSLSEDEKKLKSLATEFIEKMLGEKLEDRKVNIKRQYQKIDVLLEIQNKTEFITKGNNINPIVDMYVIIEDKVGIGLHSNQIERYRELISEKNEKDNGSRAKIKVVYYKIYDEDNTERLKENGVNVILGRENILELLKEYKDKINNSIFENYHNYLSNIETDVNSYEKKNLEDWNSNCYIGFFKELKNEKNLLEHAIGRQKDCSWGYVNNSSGGFMGMWWFPLSEEKINKLTETSDEDIYLQIEQYNQKNIIAIKYSVPKKNKNNKELSKEDFEKKVTIASEKRKELFSKLKNKLENESKDILKCENKPENIKKFKNILKNEKFQKKYFRAGQYMTVGYLEFENIDDCKDKIKILQYALNLLLKGCVKIFV
ncbi:PD-(D/E)XK nuclease family protein [Leptotrichia sp. oral taxon 221]|uniref:PD-(D/E)XK nuclease family protein n=1 Tax=Leptotrichia sp. oral taxon 221 TaxID=712362 RepID=UPI001B8C7D63|nr:PD-(D/E)XK nuclease family protein [Leptotrichia sp. oral taxon 221]QUB97039.1 PD-(D/E)XK nuclease family protein [Leptotrichia sp. oral taxon 221]